MACPKTWDTCPSVLGSMLCGAAELDFVLPSVSVVSWFKRIRDSIQMHPKSLQNLVFIYVDLVETWTSLTLNIEMLSDII